MSPSRLVARHPLFQVRSPGSNSHLTNEEHKHEAFVRFIVRRIFRRRVVSTVGTWERQKMKMPAGISCHIAFPGVGFRGSVSGVSGVEMLERGLCALVKSTVLGFRWIMVPLRWVIDSMPKSATCNKKSRTVLLFMVHMKTPVLILQMRSPRPQLPD